MAENNTIKETTKEYMKYRKNSKPMTLSIKNELREQIDKLSELTDIPKSKLVEQGIKLIVEKYKSMGIDVNEGDVEGAE